MLADGFSVCALVKADIEGVRVETEGAGKISTDAKLNLYLFHGKISTGAECNRLGTRMYKNNCAQVLMLSVQENK